MSLRSPASNWGGVQELKPQVPDWTLVEREPFSGWSGFFGSETLPRPIVYESGSALDGHLDWPVSPSSRRNLPVDADGLLGVREWK
jgi:hypothetical protein